MKNKIEDVMIILLKTNNSQHGFPLLVTELIEELEYPSFAFHYTGI